MADARRSCPSVRVAGHAATPARVDGSEMASAWSILPRRSSSSVMSPPTSGSPLAVAPAGAGTMPELRETWRSFAPQRACQPSALRCMSQNSHIVLVDGCQTTRWRSAPAAGRAPGGTGTEAKSRCSDG